MITERLYYSDPTLLEFEGIVVSSAREGDRVLTVLDQSAFYPTSGGQLFDIGTLNGVPIVEVTEGEDGEVIHISGAEIAGEGGSVHGVVDKSRRWKNRQMHTAQHILSQSFIALFELETVSVHLGEEYGAVELGSSDVATGQLEQAERFANDIVAHNLSVEILLVSPAEAARLPLRKVPGRDGVVRVIRIGDFDWSACGGTHCSSTAEVGVIKIIGMERVRSRALVKFLSGVQAIADYQARFRATDALTRTLSCGVSDLATNIGKLQAEHKDFRRQVVDLQKELIPIRAARLALQADRSGKFPLLALEVDCPDTAGLLAAEVANQIQGLVAFVVDGKLLIAVSDQSGLHAGNIAREITGRTGLRGGGSPKAAQIGGVAPEHLEQYRSILIEVISRA